MDTLGANFIVGIVVVYLLEALKRLKAVPWITQETRQLNRALSLAIAAAAAVGVHATFDPDAGALTITGLHLRSILHGLWEWAKQAGLQQGFYDAVIAPDAYRKTQAGGSIDSGSA